MKDDSPCYGCKSRIADPNCHSTCYDYYIPWCERQEAKKKKERQLKDVEDAIIQHIARSVKRSEKHRHKR